MPLAEPSAGGISLGRFGVRRLHGEMGVRMPRGPRALSDSGYYHVVMRGAGMQVIFEDAGDYEEFLSVLDRGRTSSGVDVIAWCLMSNHVHLLVGDPLGHLSDFVHWVATTYARRFNDRWGHVGHVFQERFHSVPVTDETQLLRAVRYIHNNPSKVGLAAPDEYPWSSYREYVGTARICSTSPVLDLLGGSEGFEGFAKAEDAPYFPQFAKRVSDEDASEAAAAVVWPSTVSELKQLGPATRDEKLRSMHEAGLSVRQMVRLTGIGRYAIERALHQ